MSVGLVIVSHSAKLAEGVVELAREMGGEDIAIEAAGGMADPPGAMGTDAMVVMEAVQRAASPDGVLVLMDLGSALMSAEMAVEMAENAPRVVLSEAPLVEGAIAAAATARGGADLDAVAAEARGALAPKAVRFELLNPWVASVLGGFLIGFGLLALLRHRASVGGVNILAQWLQQTKGLSAGKIQMSVDVLVVLAALFIVPPARVLQSVVGAVAIGAILTLNHKPGRYLGV